MNAFFTEASPGPVKDPKHLSIMTRKKLSFILTQTMIHFNNHYFKQLLVQLIAFCSLLSIHWVLRYIKPSERKFLHLCCLFEYSDALQISSI